MGFAARPREWWRERIRTRHASPLQLRSFAPSSVESQRVRTYLADDTRFVSKRALVLMLRRQLQRTYVYSVRLLVHVLIHVHVHILGVLGCCASALDDQLPENGGAGTEYVVDRCCSCRYICR